MNKNITFDEMDRGPDHKTKYWLVTNVNDQVGIGHVKWFGRWRQYAFFPDTGCVFERTCLRAIAQFCEDESAKLRKTWVRK